MINFNMYNLSTSFDDSICVGEVAMYTMILGNRISIYYVFPILSIFIVQQRRDCTSCYCFFFSFETIYHS